MFNFFMNTIYKTFDLLRNVKRKYCNTINNCFKKRKYNKRREEHISSIMIKSSWNRETTVKNLNDARKRIGITCAMFDKYNFHKIPIEEQVNSYLNILSGKNFRNKKLRIEVSKKIKVLTVVNITGWSYEYAEAAMKKSKIISGASYENYISYRFWEVDENSQKTYLTAGIGQKLKKKYNINKSGIRFFINKDLFNEKFNQFIGRPWLSNSNMSWKNFESTFSSVSKIIYKPRASTQGNGITVFDLDKDGRSCVYEKLKKLPKGIVEGYIKQHPEMNKFSKQSVNTIRVVTVRTFDKVNILYAAMRMGGGNAVVDNFHAGGILAIVDIDNGYLITDGFDMYGNPFIIHPITKEEIKGFKIPFWNDVIKLVKEAGVVVDGVGYVGWDVAITNDGPILIEGNVSPGSLVLQTPYAMEHKGMKYVVEKYI